MKSYEITKLHNRFSAIWGAKWDAPYEKNIELVSKEWNDALKNCKWEDAEAALIKARNALEWPPTIAEFLSFMPKHKAAAPEWTHADSAEIADQKLKRIVAKSFMEHCLLTLMIFPELEKRIFETKSKEVDFSICAVRDCVGFHIHNTARPVMWYCEQHATLEHS